MLGASANKGKPALKGDKKPEIAAAHMQHGAVERTVMWVQPKIQELGSLQQVIYLKSLGET